MEVSPEAALQGLVGALRARHDPPPGQRAVPINGWKAVDELELIMRRWRATLDHSKKSEVALGKRKADACNKHFSRLKSYLQQRLPSQLVEAICNLTAEQLSPEPVRTAVMECTDPDESKRSAALKARMEQRGDGVDDSPADTDDVSTAKNSSRTLCTDWPDLKSLSQRDVSMRARCLCVVVGKRVMCGTCQAGLPFALFVGRPLNRYA